MFRKVHTYFSPGLIGLALLLAGSCAKKSDEAKPVPKSAEETAERGPARVITRIDRDEITIAQRLTFEIEASLEEGLQIEFPKFGDKLEQFGIVEFKDAPPVLDADKRVIRKRTYVLEPFLSGDYVIPAMTLRFWKEGEQERHDLETKELKVKVTSLLPEDAKDLQIGDIAGPVDLPRKIGWKPLLAGVAVLLAIVAAAGLWIWRRKQRQTRQAPPIPPHEIAFGALEKLLAEDLIGQGAIKEFHTRLSDILRHFLEGRFDLHAPEQTTEEFLRDRRTERALSRDARNTLRDFLIQCDLVKFAEYLPGTGEIQRAFDICKEFILNTPPRPEPATQPTGGTR